MSKLAQVVVGETASEKLKEAQFGSDEPYLKKKKEDEIRIKLDEFAKELSQVKKQRDGHQAPLEAIKRMRARGLQTKTRIPLQKGRPQTPSIIQWAGINRPITLGLTILLICTVSAGLSAVLTTHQNRFAFNKLQELKDQANQLETEWGQLLIEQSTFGVEGRIEQKAIEQLQMQLPELSKIVMVSSD